MQDNHVNAIIFLVDSEVEISVNENFEETQLRQSDPIIYENSTGSSDEQLKEGMSEEIKRLRDFEVFDEKKASEVDPSAV